MSKFSRGPPSGSWPSGNGYPRGIAFLVLIVVSIALWAAVIAFLI